MSFWSRPSTTTSLLAVNSALLLALVVQNFMKRPAAHEGFSSMTMPPRMEGGMNPHASTGMGGGGDMPPHGAGGGQADEPVDLNHMMLQALVCPDDSTLTLADPGCAGGAAETRRAFVGKTTGEGLPIRAVFDKIVGKFGEAALTSEALNIRRMRRAQP